MKKVITALILLAGSAGLAGCAQTSKTYSQSGKESYTVACPGPTKSLADCMNAAGNICKERGFTVVSEDDSILTRRVTVQCGG